MQELFQAQNAFFIIKIGLLLLVPLFFIFLFVLLKQIHVMNQLVSQPRLFPILKLTTYAIMIVTIVLFLMTIAILLPSR